MAASDGRGNHLWLIIAGGDYPDCWGSKLSDYYSSYETACGEEVIIDLTDLMDEYMPNYTAALAEDKNLEASSYTDSGRRLAIYPINTGYTQFGGQIRGDIVDKLKLELPETFDDMYDLLKAMKSEYPESQPLILSKDGSQNCSWLGGGLGVMTTVSWRPFVQMNLYQEDGQVKLGLLEPEYKEYLELISKWYGEGLIYQDFFTNEGMGLPQDAIAYDTSFVWYGSVNEIPTLTGILRNEGAYIEGMADVTRKPGETIHLGDSTAKSITANGGYCVSTGCEHPEYVLQYMDYFYSEAGGMAANFGVEGETYTIENGRPAYTDMILNNDTYTYVSALFKYCIYEGPFELDVNRYFAAFDENQKEAVERWESNRDEDWNLPAGLTLTTEETETRSNLIAEIGTEATPERIAAEGFEAVILALGAEPAQPNIPGAESGISVLSVYEHPEQLAQQVVIVGGSETGLETALFLARRGHQVTLLTWREKAAYNAHDVHFREIMEEIWQKEANLHIITHSQTVEIGRDYVVYQSGGKQQKLPCGSVVLSCGMAPRQQDVTRYGMLCPSVHVIGDCHRSGDIRNAMRDGYAAACRV